MSARTKFIVTKQVEEFIQPKRPDRKAFPPHGDVPVRRALLVDNNKYHPGTARRHKEMRKAAARALNNVKVDADGFVTKLTWRNVCDLNDFEFLGLQHERAAGHSRHAGR